MELSHTKLRYQLQSIRCEIIRARVRTCRKLTADIKKWSKKQLVESKKGKSTRKVQRLTDELHHLRKMKPNTIAKFVLSKTEDFVETLKRLPDISPQLRALAKLYYNKLITPIVKQFRKKFPKWQETLPKLLENDPEVIETEGIPTVNKMIESRTTNSSCNISDSDSPDKESDEEISSDEEGISEHSFGGEIKFTQNECIKNIVDNCSENLNEKVKFNNLKRKKISDLTVPKIDSPSTKRKNSISNFPKKLKSSPTRQDTKKSLSPARSESEHCNTSGDHNNKWSVESMDESDSNSTEKFFTNEPIEKINNQSISNVKKLIISPQQNTENDVSKSNNSSTDTDSEEDSDNSSSCYNVESSIPLSKHNNSNESTGISCEESNENFSEESGSTEPTESNETNSSTLLICTETNQRNISRNINSKISKNETESIQPQKHEDPFFMTSDNKKYLTYAKIEEPKLQPLFSSNDTSNAADRPFRKMNNKNFDLNSKSRAANQVPKHRNQFRNNNYDNNKSIFSDNSVDSCRLHPSWEAKKRMSTILPFQGKRITFN